jgi:hypothetical protein
MANIFKSLESYISNKYRNSVDKKIMYAFKDDEEKLNWYNKWKISKTYRNEYSNKFDEYIFREFDLLTDESVIENGPIDDIVKVISFPKLIYEIFTKIPGRMITSLEHYYQREVIDKNKQKIVIEKLSDPLFNDIWSYGHQFVLYGNRLQLKDGFEIRTDDFDDFIKDIEEPLRKVQEIKKLYQKRYSIWDI